METGAHQVPGGLTNKYASYQPAHLKVKLRINIVFIHEALSLSFPSQICAPDWPILWIEGNIYKIIGQPLEQAVCLFCSVSSRSENKSR